MNDTGKNLSILTLLTGIILSTVIFVLSIKATYIYIETLDKMERDVADSLSQTCKLIANQVVPFINDYSPVEYENIIINIINTKRKYILAVELFDYNMGEITNTKFVVRKMVINDEVVDSSKENRHLMLEVCCTKTVDVLHIDKIIGKVKIYGYIRNESEINGIFISELVDIMFVIFFIGIALFTSTRLFIIKPFNDLYLEIKSINLLDVDEIKLKSSFISEFSTIKDSFNYTLRSLKSLKEESDLKSENMEYMATHDSLTNLPNRTLLHERVEGTILKTEKSFKHKFAILFIDLDNFKEINDTHGHKMGDKVLIEAAKRFNDVKREFDTLARIGGDEFVLIVDNITKDDDAITEAKKILGVFSELFVVKKNKFHLGCSIGISFYPDHGFDYTELTKHADTAMYEAKAQGRNRYRIFDEEMSKQVEDKLNTENELREAIKNGGIFAFFQPKVNASTKKINAFEALIRWKKDGKFVPPGMFLPIAQQSSLIVELDWIIMKQSIDFITDLHLRENNLVESISVNVTEKEFHDKYFISNSFKYMKSVGCKPEWIELEITEDSLMTNFKEIIDVMKNLEDSGIKFSLDDFGTGYSSLAYLKRLPISTLKIDKSFIDGVPADDDDIIIVSAIISLANSLNLKIVAEGVETREQHDFLVEQGCNYIQGYYYFKPMQVTEILKHLEIE